MVSQARKAQAAEQGARDISQFWGDVAAEQSIAAGAEIEARVMEAPDLHALLSSGSTEYAGSLGLDAILYDLAGRGFDHNDLDKFLKDLWTSQIDARVEASTGAEL